MPFFEITDFSPGIQSKQSITNPPGAAVAAHTFGCMSEGKALVPGPRLSGRHSITFNDITTEATGNLFSNGGVFISGVKAIGPIYSSETVTRNTNLNRTEVIVGMEFWVGSGNPAVGYSDVWRYQRDKGTPAWVRMHPYPINNGSGEYGPAPGSMAIEFARNNPTAPAEVGSPVVVTLPYRGTPWMWPDPDDGGSTAAAINCVQHMYVTATAGTYTLTYNGQTTGSLDWDAAFGAVDTALEALSNIGAGDVAVTGLRADFTITFGTALAGTDVPQIVPNVGSLTGGTATVRMQTRGRAAAATGEGSSVRIMDSGWHFNTDGNAEPGNVLFPPEDCIAHQGRMVLFPLIIYPVAYPLRNFSSQEGFYFTNKNDFTSMPSLAGFYDQIFDSDDPYGFATFGSMTDDQLFILKRKGGAVKIMGDLDDPQSVNLPFVKSPGFAICKGARTPVGFAYAVENGGVWVWEGGDTSTPIGQAMEDDFWRPVAALAGHGYEVGPTSMSSWGEWIVAPNNYIFDIVNMSWWRIFPTDQDAEDHVNIPTSGTVLDLEEHGQAFSHSDADHNDRWCYFTPRHIYETSPYPLWEFDKRVRASGYAWQSHPIQATSTERKTEVKAVSLTASGTGTITVVIKGKTLYQQAVFTVSSEFPTKFVQPIKVHDTHIQIMILSKSDDFQHNLNSYSPAAGTTGVLPAPTVYAVGVDIEESHRVPVATSVGAPT